MCKTIRIRKYGWMDGGETEKVLESQESARPLCQYWFIRDASCTEFMIPPSSSTGVRRKVEAYRPRHGERWKHLITSVNSISPHRRAFSSFFLSASSRNYIWCYFGHFSGPPPSANGSTARTQRVSIAWFLFNIYRALKIPFATPIKSELFIVGEKWRSKCAFESSLIRILGWIGGKIVIW